MPLQLSADLKFPKGLPDPLTTHAKDELLGLVRRIVSSTYNQDVIEIFKYNFCKASGEQYSRSSSPSWAESDLEWMASSAGSNAATFIAAFFDSCEELGTKGIAVPDYEVINRTLEKHDIHFRIKDKKLIAAAGFVATPDLEPSQVEIVERALADARTLISTAGPSSVVDRLHTALHGYLIYLCKEKGIDTTEASTSKVFKTLRAQHPAFANDGHMGKEVNQLLNGFATSIDAFSQLRNNASLAHANQLLEEPEATVVVNGTFTIFRYIQDCLNRYAK